MAIDPKLLEILVCPACHGGVELQGSDALGCVACRRVYPIRDDIPVMLVEDAGRPDLPTTDDTGS